MVRDRGPWPLFLVGPQGRLKTCFGLLLCDATRGAVYTTVEGLTARVFPRPHQPPFDWDCLAPKYCPLVVLDELGVRQNVIDTTYLAVQQLLDAREKSPLVVISNVEPEGIDSLFDDRIGSRLRAGNVVHLGGTDQRLKGR